MEIIDISENGYGIAKKDGKVYFIKNAIYGERVEIEEVNILKKGNIFYVDKYKTISESPYIEKNIYEKFTKSEIETFVNSNGSSLVYIKYEKEKQLKKKKIIDAYTKIVKKLDQDEKEILRKIQVIGEEKNRFGYRNKATIKFDGQNFGYYLKNTNIVLPIDRCILSSENINNKLKELITKYKYTKKIEKRTIDEIKDVKVQNRKVEDILIKENTNTNKIGELEFEYGDKSFIQINKYNTEKLYDKICEYSEKIVKKEKRKLRIADIYAGVGSIGIYVKKMLGKKITQIIGIEIVEEAVKYANNNARKNGIKEEFKYIVGDGYNILKEVEKEDIVIVDPPRKGLGQKFTDQLVEKKVENIIYISCDVATMARDIQNIKMKDEKYRIMEMSVVDMFPNTMHVETVALLQRR